MRHLLRMLAIVSISCAPPEEPGSDRAAPSDGVRAPDRAGPRAAGPEEAALRLTLDRAHALADSIEDVLRPLPLMRPGEEEALRRYGQAAQLARARALGVRPSTEAELEAAIREGRLVTLEDSTGHWILRDLQSSRPLVTPDTRALIRHIASAFQDRLAAIGLPPYRLEITSALRTAADQALLRQENVNAAGGVSTHEFGTSVDLAYSAFAPPAEIPAGVVADGPAWMAPYLEAIAASVLESVSARKSRELQAILGEVLREAQAEGLVQVTLERLQPVYHITVARRIAEGGS
ncbi:MAG TPA: DUF5715 family protein [Longimicrobiales bacterium]|nr:DUF5715 family protein [Longimicrobiales bacterium]